MNKQRRRKQKARRKARLREDATPAVALRERGAVSPRGGSKRKVTIIEAGWGSSGYYPKEVLERDGAKAWPAGTHMYMNHPTMQEEWDRPERDAKDLAAVLETTPRMEGNELVAEAKVFEHWRPVVDEIAPHIGLSIRADGELQEGERDGRSGPIVESITEGYSVDFVTLPGAGGKVGQLIESARDHKQPTLQETEPKSDPEGEAVFARLQEDLNALNTEGNKLTIGESRTPGRKDGDLVEVSEKELSELRESVRQTKERVESLEEAKTQEKDRADRAEDALLTERASRIVTEALAEEGENALPKLPERAVTRVKEASLRDKPPVGENGQIDKDKLVERVRKFAKEEDEYLHGEARGKGVTDMGESAETGNGSSESSEEDTKKLEESFRRSGMSEEAAKIAAQGR